MVPCVVRTEGEILQFGPLASGAGEQERDAVGKGGRDECACATTCEPFSAWKAGRTRLATDLLAEESSYGGERKLTIEARARADSVLGATDLARRCLQQRTYGMAAWP